MLSLIGLAISAVFLMSAAVVAVFYPLHNLDDCVRANNYMFLFDLGMAVGALIAVIGLFV